MVMSPNRTPRAGKKVRLVVLHTAEGARTTAELGRYFARASTKASSHAGVDENGLELYVPYEFAAWTLRSGNAVSDNLELCGFAKWTREEWLTKHRPMLEHAARWVRDRCRARDIPIRKLTPAQVKAGEAGVIGHHDWTVGMKDGTHTDPGPTFPWDVVMALATGGSSSPDPEDDMPSLDDVRKAVREEVAKQLGTVAKRDDVGFARSQILTALGVADPIKAPASGGAPDARIAALTDAIRALTDAVRALAVDE